MALSELPESASTPIAGSSRAESSSTPEPLRSPGAAYLRRAALAAGAALIGLVGWLVGDLVSATIAVLAAIIVWLLSSEWRLRAAVRRICGEGRQLIAGTTAAHPLAKAPPLADVPERFSAYVAEARSRLTEQAQQRLRAEVKLRETQERYTLAISGANDGMWEWNLKTGNAYFSPRWKSMLGYDEAAIGDDIGEWNSRIHPEDRERAMAELQAHLDGRAERFEYEHRLLQQDGSWRWVLARATAVRHANGKPYRLVGLNTDISQSRQVQQVLIDLADGLNGLQGEQAYGALVQKFATLIGTEEAFLAECCVDRTNRVRMLAHWKRDGPAECVEFDLPGTPCEEVIAGKRTVFAPRGVSARWPIERQFGTQGYLGMPCIDTKGEVIGHIACHDKVEISGDIPHDAILKLFAVRASVEMERVVLNGVRARLSAAQAGAPLSELDRGLT
ncbi:MAG: PAS domain-containing protein [Betaproteobacteria bacterium]